MVVVDSNVVQVYDIVRIHLATFFLVVLEQQQRLVGLSLCADALVDGLYPARTGSLVGLRGVRVFGRLLVERSGLAEASTLIGHIGTFQLLSQGCGAYDGFLQGVVHAYSQLILGFSQQFKLVFRHWQLVRLFAVECYKQCRNSIDGSFPCFLKCFLLGLGGIKVKALFVAFGVVVLL